LLSSLQSAVNSDDTGTASSVLSKLKEYLADNPAPQASFSTYSGDGTVSSNSSSALSILA
jgi:hypothetical protein